MPSPASSYKPDVSISVFSWPWYICSFSTTFTFYGSIPDETVVLYIFSIIAAISDPFE